MVPNGWNEFALGEVMEFKNGLNFTKADSGESIKVVGVGDFQGRRELDATLSLSTVRVANKVKDDELLLDGDLLFVRSNGNKNLIGRCLFFSRVEERLSFSGFTIRGRVKAESVLPEYMAYFARSSIMLRQIRRNGGGTNISNLSQKILCDIRALIPPLVEQAKITQILSTWDKAIASTEKLLANSQQQKKALMQQLLTGKKRLRDENGVPFSGEWSWVKASELFQAVSKKNNSGSEELLAVTQDQGVVIRSQLDRRVVMPAGSTQGYKLVEPGNFIISLRSFQGGLEYSRYKGLVSPAYTVLEPIKGVDDGFYRQYFKSYDFIGHLAVAVIGIRDGKQISYSDFGFLKLPYPSLPEQRRIAASLTVVDQEIEAFRLKCDLLNQEKRALMQQLLPGKRRVAVEEVE